MPQQFSSAETLPELFARARQERVFPGGQVWLEHDEKIVAHESFGALTYEEDSPVVRRGTLYDVASLSKLFTLTAFLIASREHKISVDEPIAKFLPEFQKSPYRAVTLRQLLNHSSDIAMQIQSLHTLPVEEWTSIIARAGHWPNPHPRPMVSYSCTNYFLLARVVETLISQPISQFLETQLLQPLQLKSTTFCPPDLSRVAPTEIGADGQPFRGVAHDGAARAYFEQTNNFCGNAGIFATAGDLAKFCKLWLNEGTFGNRQILHPGDVKSSFADTLPENSQRRGWCWQMDAAFFMSELAPKNSAGHTGFTGPTLWLNAQTKHLCIVLNNRVFPTRNGPERMEFHRAIAAHLLLNSASK